MSLTAPSLTFQRGDWAILKRQVSHIAYIVACGNDDPYRVYLLGTGLGPSLFPALPGGQLHHWRDNNGGWRVGQLPLQLGHLRPRHMANGAAHGLPHPKGRGRYSKIQTIELWPVSIYSCVVHLCEIFFFYDKNSNPLVAMSIIFKFYANWK